MEKEIGWIRFEPRDFASLWQLNLLFSTRKKQTLLEGELAEPQRPISKRPWQVRPSR